MSSPADILISLSIEKEGKFYEIYDCICKNVRPSSIITRDELEHPAVSVVDPEYSNFFKEINCPPIVFYYKGDLSLVDNEESKLKVAILQDNTRVFLFTIEDNDCIVDWLVCCENIANVDWVVEKVIEMTTA